MAGLIRELLRTQAIPALEALFSAYEAERQSRDVWLGEQLDGSPEIREAGLEAAFTNAVSSQLYTVAGCILAVGDSIVQACAIEDLAEPTGLGRRYFGRFVADGVPFGAALWAGANAFRHSPEWAAGGEPFKSTRRELERMGAPLDDSAPYHILEGARTTTARTFLNELDATCLELEAGVECGDCHHPASAHRRERSERGSGCSYPTDLATVSPGPSSIAEFTATMIERARAGVGLCTCGSSRESVGAAFLKGVQAAGES